LKNRSNILIGVSNGNPVGKASIMYFNAFNFGEIIMNFQVLSYKNGN
jgi:hypothetical protein